MFARWGSCIKYSSESFPIRKLGSLSLGNKPSLPNIITIEDMLGIFSRCCRTHNRLTWKQQKIFGRVQESSKYVSISSNHLISVSFNLISIKDSSQAKIWNFWLHHYQVTYYLLLNLYVQSSAYNLHEDKEAPKQCHI